MLTTKTLLNLILATCWAIKQVDYTNTFTQAELAEKISVDIPMRFGEKNKLDKILRLVKSLYGLKQIPKTFFVKLSAGLVEGRFIVSNHNPYVFMKKDRICIVNVNNTIIAGTDSNKIDELVKDLIVSDQNYVHNFQLRDEGEIGYFLEIIIDKIGKRQFDLTQTELINKVLKTL